MNQVSLRFAGIDVPVQPKQRADPERNTAETMTAAALLTRAREQAGRAQQQTPVPVFEDGDGNAFTIVTLPDGTSAAQPWIAGTDSQGLEQGASGGGFTRHEDIQAASSSSAQPEGAPAVVQAAAVQVARGQSENPESTADAMKGMVTQFALNSAQGQLTDYLAGLLDNASSTASPADSIKWFVDPGQQQQPSVLSGALGKVSGQIVDLVSSQLLQRLMPTVDDTSSSEEHLVAHFSNKLVAEVKEQATRYLQSMVTDKALDSATGIQGQLEKFFGASGGTIPVGRIGDLDTAQGTILKGAATVFVNGLPAARLTDTIDMKTPADAGQVVSGNPTIEVESQPLTGKEHVGLGLKGTVALVTSGSPDVFMGPEGIPVTIPTSPEATSNDATSGAAASPSGSDGSPNATTKQPKKPAPLAPSNNETAPQAGPKTPDDAEPSPTPTPPPVPGPAPDQPEPASDRTDPPSAQKDPTKPAPVPPPAPTRPAQSTGESEVGRPVREAPRPEPTVTPEPKPGPAPVLPPSVSSNPAAPDLLPESVLSVVNPVLTRAYQAGTVVTEAVRFGQSSGSVEALALRFGYGVLGPQDLSAASIAQTMGPLGARVILPLNIAYTVGSLASTNNRIRELVQQGNTYQAWVEFLNANPLMPRKVAEWCATPINNWAEGFKDRHGLRRRPKS